MKGFFYSFTCIVGCVVLCSSVRADFYMCKDPSGAVQYTNVPAGANCKPFVMKKRTSRYWSPATPSCKTSRYDRQIWSAGKRYDVDPFLIKAVICAESAFNSAAVSKKGALGLMQLMPATARELQVSDPFNPKQNINAGTRYLRLMLDTFQGNVTLSLAAYNAGPGLVSRVRGIPKNPETMRYVANVLAHYKSYKRRAKKG